MPLTPGTKLGPYQIRSAIGSGGMGEVFAAEDTRLKRRVAIKVLSAEAASDDESRERFRREARAIAALNHPNIVTIHSVEEFGGLLLLVMEYVDGSTLDGLIPVRGLPLETFFPTALAIVKAVAAAHEKGITHRDLKSTNVMITTRGDVKVLDFGLAKIHEGDLPEASTEAVLTRSYEVIGTPAYMSPEQAEGRVVDSRSDIFSLGILLYEMAVGRRPFVGSSTAAVLSAILRDDPPSIIEVRPELPVGLSQIIKRSLEKAPADRYQTATDLWRDLHELILARQPVTTPSFADHLRSSIGAKVVAAVAVGGVLVLGLGTVWLTFRNNDAATWFDAANLTRLTSEGSAVAAISPDGRYLVHVKDADAQPSLWVRQTGTVADVQIVTPTNQLYQSITYSPDGEYVYFTTFPEGGVIGSLFRVAALGGVPRQILNDVDTGVTFSPEGERLAFIRGEAAGGVAHVMVADVDGQNERRIATDQGFLFAKPSWSPDGRLISVVARVPDGAGELVYGVRSDNGFSEPLTDPWASVEAVVWLPDGKSFLIAAADVVGNSSQVWQILYPSRERRRVTNDVNSYSMISVSADARLVSAVQSRTFATLWATTPTHEYSAQLLSGRSDDGAKGVAWSKTGPIIFTSSRSGVPALWRVESDGTGLRQVAEGPGSGPTVPKDGNWMAFIREDPTGMHLWRSFLDGSGPVSLASATFISRPVAGDDQSLFYAALVQGQVRAFRFSFAGEKATRLSDADFFPTDRLRNGDLLGYTFEPLRTHGFAAILPTGGQALRRLTHVQVAHEHFDSLRATPQNAVTFIQQRDGRSEVWRQPIENGPAVKVTDSSGDSVFAYAWSPDGKRLVVSRGRIESEVVLIRRQ